MTHAEGTPVVLLLLDCGALTLGEETTLLSLRKLLDCRTVGHSETTRLRMSWI
jgi:hypothetical protein